MTEQGAAGSEILIEHAASISWIVLNRPAHANALSSTLLNGFSEALVRLETEGRPIVGIRANGSGFCAGMDLTEYGGPAAIDPVADADRLKRNVQRWLAIWDHPKPVIAAVHGYCMGVGAQLCVFADLTIVADNARIGEPTVPIGGGYIAPTWVSLVGAKRAKEFAFVPGNTIDGSTAVEWGWANYCVPLDRLTATAEALADRMAMVPADVLKMKKRSINHAAEAAGFRNATNGISEMDALLHLAPSVTAIRDRIRSQGLKQVIAEYKGASSRDTVTAMSKGHRE